MHLVSKNKLQVNSGISGTKEVIVIGKLYQELIIIEQNMGINFQYTYIDSETAEILESKTFNATEEDQQQLYQAVKENLPDIDVDFSAWYKALIFESFRVQMATTFQIPVTDIDIIE